MEINNRFLIGDKVGIRNNFKSIVGTVVAFVVTSKEDVNYAVDYFDQVGRKVTEIFKESEITEEYES
jgi:hypothetical protein